MIRPILAIYSFLQRHRVLGSLVLYTCITALVLISGTLGFKEDISDFLPSDSRYQESMSIYQQVNGADRIFLLFEMKDTTRLDSQRVMEAVDAFEQEAQERGWSVMTRAGGDKVQQTIDFVYANAPLLLQSGESERLYSLSCPDSIRLALRRDRQALMYPGVSMVTKVITSDPLGFFTPLLGSLQSGSGGASVSINDDYIFTPDGRGAIAILDSPYGSSETSHNGDLVAELQDCTDAIEASIGDVRILATGAPIIAVGNSGQIKKDSILAAIISIILIIGVLWYTIRSFKSILCILFSVIFGYLLALSGMALIEGEVSMIVVGIASILIGIAINYPLHFVLHYREKHSVEQTLRDIAEPLVVGNITTVAAFVALIPLNSVALRDLGIFASLMLAGTIIFVIVFLPQLYRDDATMRARHQGASESCGETVCELDGGKPEEEYVPHIKHNWIAVVAFVVVTLVLGYFSFFSEFDTDLHNINYMTSQQTDLLRRMEHIRRESLDSSQLYVVTEAAYRDSVLDARDGLIVSPDRQKKRLDAWDEFVAQRGETLISEVRKIAGEEGFSESAFDSFYSILRGRYTPRELEDFSPLSEIGVGGYLLSDRLVEMHNVPKSSAPELVSKINSEGPEGRWAFDIAGLNQTIAQSVSDNFNYIGIVCSLVVFFFLWLSFGKLRYAIIAFLPMIVAWLWILGAMHLLHIRFNLVNIILATFIFGQGDDYSIFITEGLIYEHKHHRRILKSYRRSILISAVIMFIGIGSLIVARHPALRSLGEITIIGMASVVLMACILPPIVFKFFLWVDSKKRAK